jgi:hypothetical protein
MKNTLLLAFGLLWTGVLFSSPLVLVKMPHEYTKNFPPESLIQDHFSHPLYWVGYVEEKNLKAVPQIERLEERQWALGAYDRKTLELKRVNASEAYAGYHNYTALTEELQKAVAAHPNLVRLASAGKSVQGRELWYVVVSDNVNQSENEPKFIYHANMHGDEVVGRELMLYFLQHLLEQYQKEGRITQLVNNSEIFIMPSMNPDGFELGTRGNARGKDLNRNFPDRFNSPSDTPNGREIEVQHMMRLAQENHFVYGINWHGGEICFNLPWGNIKNKPENKFGDDSFFYPIGREYTALNSPMHSNHQGNFDHGLTYGYEWYPVNGGINDWFNFYRRSVHSVIELSVTKWPSASQLPKFWDDNREAMLTYLMHGLRGVHLDVRDASGNSVKNPTIKVASLPKRPLTFDTGYIHRLTGAGTQEIKISAAGFKEKSLYVSATEFNGTFIPVTLQQ